MLKSPSKSNAISRPSRVAAALARIARRMALGARLHRLGPLVDQAHRPAELPGGDREQRLHREVELAAEAAADRRRARCGPAPARCRGRARSRRGPCTASACRRRRGSGAAPSAARADDLGVARLGLDVGVLDEARSRSAASATCGAPASARVDVAAHDAAAAQHVVGVARVQRAGARGASAASMSACGGSGVQRIGSRRRSIARDVAASPTSASTASPRKRTTPSASTGWSRRSGKIANALPGTSAAVSTSTRPGRRARSASRSPSAKRACGCGERTDAQRQQRAGAGAGVGAEALAARRPWPARRAAATRAPTAWPAGGDRRRVGDAAGGNRSTASTILR